MVVRGAPVKSSEEAQAVPNEVIVQIAPDSSPEEVDAVRSKLGAKLLETTETLGLELWSVPDKTADRLITNLESIKPEIDPVILDAHENRVYKVTQTLPNDPEIGQLWGLNNQGQNGGKVDADIDAPEAWELETGTNDVVVGVIDTGIDYTHPDLDDNIWNNPGEIAGNGIDDDANGFVDDFHGYDFVNEDGDPTDDFFHGTHVAGTIAAEGNNNLGVTGVAWDAQLMAIKVLDSGGNGNEFDIIQGIEYSALNGADITNNSYRGYGFSQGIYDAVRMAGESGQLFVAAAGNETNDNDANPAYPASFDLDNIVSVAATTSTDNLASFSNFGATSVDLGAPGENILSTLPGSGYGFESGTSMASPHVAGAAALLLSLDPSLSVTELKSLLLDTTDPLPDLAGRSVTGGRLNIANALVAATPPVPINGTERDDVLTGTSGRDIIHGLGGNDTIQGLQGSDQLFGDGGRDLVAGGDGNDTLHGGSGNDNLLGGNGNDSVFGDDGNDAILGGEGDDTLDGGRGLDRILGDVGNDTVTGGSANDMLDGGEGDDQVAGGEGDDKVRGGRGIDRLTGDAGNDGLVGGLGNDTIDGGSGRDRLVGVDPSNAAVAGRGEVDELTGGRHGDTFVLGDVGGVYYKDGNPLTTGEADYALIKDLNPAEDRIELSGAAGAYILDFFRTDAGIFNADLIHDSGDTARGDRIATLERVDLDLSISDRTFVFLGGTGAETGRAVAEKASAEKPGELVAQQDTIPLPITLVDGGDFQWDIQGDGTIIDGSFDAYDNGLQLETFPTLSNAETEEDGREIVLGPAPFGGVEGVQAARKIYVPTDHSWARFLEVVTNNSASAVNLSLNILTNFGSDDQTSIVATSSGDQTFDVNDQWIVSDDVNAGGDPTMLHVIAGADALSPSSAVLNLDQLNFGYNLSLAPGETQIIMHFASQNPDQAAALATAPLLADPDADALAGISRTELAQIVNFAGEEPVPVIGTEGDDFLTGTNRADIIQGRGGNDLIQGLGGSDDLSGEAGNDVIAGGPGTDVLSGGTGDDLLSGDAGNDTLGGDAGADDLAGGDGNDTLDGGQGNDRLLGEIGNDRIEGGDGNDTADGGDGTDVVAGGQGNDQVLGGAGDDQVAGNDGADRLGGGAGNDRLNGGAGNDHLNGVNTAAGTFGVGEADVLAGGAGSDVFVLGDERHVFYDDLIATSTGESDFALLTDFRAGEDLIELNGRSDLYRLDFYAPSSGVFNAALIYDTDEARGELVAVLENVSVNLQITDLGFHFV